MTDLALDPLTTPAGLMERLFLHETRSPAYGRAYEQTQALKAMRLMRQVLRNRLKQPALWGAKGALDEIPLITIKSQFGEFGLYPKLPVQFMKHVNEMVSSANAPGSYLHDLNLQHVKDAILVATETVPPPDISALNVTSWRTEGASSPSARFRKVTTVQGNDFYEVVR